MGFLQGDELGPTMGIELGLLLGEAFWIKVLQSWE
jgi:hypothetical protein